MKRLTLNDAIGQTLLAKIGIDEQTLLRFTEGYVTLETHYESYEIMDFTDLEDPLCQLHRVPVDKRTELLALGLITQEDADQATRKYDEMCADYARQREDHQRAMYEELRKKFEST